jgi:hypothetical protein
MSIGNELVPFFQKRFHGRPGVYAFKQHGVGHDCVGVFIEQVFSFKFNEQRFIAISHDGLEEFEDPIGVCARYYIVRISDQKFQKVKNKKIDLHDAFRDAEDGEIICLFLPFDLKNVRGEAIVRMVRSDTFFYQWEELFPFEGTYLIYDLDEEEESIREKQATEARFRATISGKLYYWYKEKIDRVVDYLLSLEKEKFQ